MQREIVDIYRRCFSGGKCCWGICMKSTNGRECYKYLDRMPFLPFLLYVLISNMLSKNGAINRCVEKVKLGNISLLLDLVLVYMIGGRNMLLND